MRHNASLKTSPLNKNETTPWRSKRRTDQKTQKTSSALQRVGIYPTWWGTGQRDELPQQPQNDLKVWKPVPKNIWTQTHCVAILKSLQSLWDQGPNKFDIKMCFINIDLLSWLNILQRQISHWLKKILSVGKPVSWFLYSATESL